MWAHFGHFVGTVIGIFFNAIGTTGLGKITDCLFVVLVTLFSIRHAHKRGGWSAVKQFWDEEAKFALRASLIAACCLYVPILFWSVGTGVYEDHEGLVSRSRSQRASIRTADGILKEQKEFDSQKFTACQNDNSRMVGRNETLGKQNRDQQDTINNCQTQALKLLTPEAFKITPVTLESPHPGVDAQTWKVLLITNKSVTPIDLIVTCNKRMKGISGEVLGGGGVQLYGGADKIMPNAYELHITSPAWTVVTPLELNVSYSGGEDISCGFNER
jgi:nitrogen fixation-related uncharacterized protein